MATLLKRDRVRTVALGVLVLCCVGFVGSMTYLQSRAATAPPIITRQAPKPELVAETEARKKEKILDLRDKWQVWAKAHQPELRAMLAAKPDDLAALAVLSRAIPSTPTKENCGISNDDLSGVANFADPVVVMAAWHHMGDDVEAAADAKTAEAIEKDKQRTQKYERAWFASVHDVIVTSTSSSWSKKNYCLYASGRVLECEYVLPITKQPFVEIAPSYDFLTSEK